MNNQPAPSKFLHWFDPRFRQAGTWAFILNRITGLGLALYLLLHLIMLSKLAQGETAYNEFIALAKTPVIKVGEMLVIAGGIIHGLNGIRVGLTSIGIGTRYQKPMFFGLMAVSIALIAFFGYVVFLGE